MLKIQEIYARYFMHIVYINNVPTFRSELASHILFTFEIIQDLICPHFFRIRCKILN